MQELRIALTVLPVGPRGEGAIDETEPLWFALQIAAGFAEEESPSVIDTLWPWVLHVIRNDKVELTAWVIDNNVAGAPFDLFADVPAADDFTFVFRKAITETYAAAAIRDELDVRLLLPGDAARDEDHERASFPARVQYLATLPGGLSNRLLATLYVPVPVNELFARNPQGVWEPKGDTLWIAPKAVMRTAEVALTGPPAAAADPELQKIGGMDGMLPVAAIGPGFDLAGFLAPGDSVFDLKTYEVPISAGDRRFIEMETLLRDVLDPFAELDHLRASDARDRLELVTTAPPARRVVPEETFTAFLEICRVRTLATELASVFPFGLHELARLLLPSGKPMPALVIPRWWGPDLTADLSGRLLEVARKLAMRIGIAQDDDRATLRKVAEQGGFAVIAGLLAKAFDETLAAMGSEADDLRIAWRFGESSSSVIAERRATLAMSVVSDLRERREVPLVLASLGGVDLPNDSKSALRDAAKNRIGDRWVARREPSVLEALASVGRAASNEELEIAPAAIDELASAYLDAVFPQKTDARSELPGRGLSLLVGPENHRVVHEDNGAADASRSPYREVAGVLILARRGADRTDLENRPWRLVTGGTAFAGDLNGRLFAPNQAPPIEDEQWLPELLPLPLRPVFQQKVARADLEYHGQPMLAQSALDRAYAAEDYAIEEIAGLAAAYNFQPLGNFEQRLPDAAKVNRAPALRYGDAYEFRGGVIDQAGGLPDAIADDARPWTLDLAKLAAPTAIANDVITYRRAVPVGEVNLLPAKAWPALPNDVALRVREWWSEAHQDADTLPVVLFSDQGRLTGARGTTTFNVLPPAIDEHTLMRWAMPRLGDPQAAAAIADLKKAMTAVLVARSERRSVQLHDPAVTSLGIRIRGAASDNQIVSLLEQTIPLAGGALPHQRAPIAVDVTAAPFGGAPRADVSQDSRRVTIVIPEGAFAALEIFPLVAKSDFDARFLAFDDLVDGTAPFANHVAFRPSVVLFEGATSELPDAEKLYEALQLVEQNGDVAVRFGNAPASLVFVDRFAIERERWVWRNLPVVTSELENVNDPVDRRRLLASAPPREAFDAATRDTSPAVAEWEQLAALDRGFVDRGESAGRWPRVPAGDVLLMIDNRDAVTAADYLRFGLRVRSRYAGVLPEKDRERRAAKGASVRKRIAIGFRGRKIKPPKILSIVPLTASLENDPLETPPRVSPFLVLLDETFFREYGVGERIDLHLTLENLDFHEKPETATLPYRTGPLPDHWMPHPVAAQPLPYFRGLKRTAAEDESDPIALDLFGPFGYSLDVTPSEALANASAFVAYPPHDVGPQWAMFARLRRLLDRPSAGLVSDWSDSHALYTLPDARLLATKTGDRPAIEIDGGTATLTGLRLILDPLATPKAGQANPLKNSEAATQYRYFLLVSRVVPGAGQAFDAELPVGLWRMPLFDPESGYQREGSFEVELTRSAPVMPIAADNGAMIVLDGADYRGRVIEVLLNGRYEGPSRIDTAPRWRDFWTSLLDERPDADHDAAGMIRRVSDAFAVRAG